MQCLCFLGVKCLMAWALPCWLWNQFQFECLFTKRIWLLKPVSDSAGFGANKQGLNWYCPVIHFSYSEQVQSHVALPLLSDCIHGCHRQMSHNNTEIMYSYLLPYFTIWHFALHISLDHPSPIQLALPQQETAGWGDGGWGERWWIGRRNPSRGSVSPNLGVQWNLY
jgi:hypothetical protein